MAYLALFFRRKIMLTTKDKYLYKDGKRFFYLADTCWGAFGSIDMPGLALLS